MDRSGLERRFKEQVDTLRREYFWFSALALLVSAVLLAGAGLAVFLVLSGVGIHRRLRLPLTLAFMFLFLLLGYWIFRRRQTDGGTLERLGASAAGNRLSFGGGRRRGIDWQLWKTDFAASSYLLAPFLISSSLPFFFIREVLSGRRAFASENAVRVALEVLADGGERVDWSTLASLSPGDGEAMMQAVRLLVEMKLFLVKGTGKDFHLLRTIEGQKFMAATTSGINS